MAIGRVKGHRGTNGEMTVLIHDGDAVEWETLERVWLALGDAGTVLASLNAGAAAAPPADPKMAVELAFWNTIKDARDPAMFEAYLRRYPQGAFADIARLKILNLAASR